VNPSGGLLFNSQNLEGFIGIFLATLVAADLETFVDSGARSDGICLAE
jgi:hypothetical protein